MLAASSFRGGLGLAALARLAGGRRFAAGRRLAPVRGLVAVRRFAVVRRLAVVRRFSGVRFFRVEREVAARFLRFAMSRLLSRAQDGTSQGPYTFRDYSSRTYEDGLCHTVANGPNSLSQ